MHSSVEWCAEPGTRTRRGHMRFTHAPRRRGPHTKMLCVTMILYTIPIFDLRNAETLFPRRRARVAMSGTPTAHRCVFWVFFIRDRIRAMNMFVTHKCEERMSNFSICAFGLPTRVRQLERSHFESGEIQS